jgi:hypothetical protein
MIISLILIFKSIVLIAFINNVSFEKKTMMKNNFI